MQERDEEELGEAVLARGVEVAYQDWDGDGPGAGAGRVSVYRFNRKLYVSHDAGIEGPYESLTEAMRINGINRRSAATVAIWTADSGFTFRR